MKRSFTLLLISIFMFLFLMSGSSCNSGSPEDFRSLSKYFYKRFEGRIGDKLKIVMNLYREDTLIAGSYYYENKGIPIEITYNSRIDSTGNVYIEEGSWDKENNLNTTGYFRGKFVNDHELRGKWEKPNSNIQYDFVLTEHYPKGTVAFDIKRDEKSYGDCGESSPCVSISYSYPVIKKMPDEDLEKQINDMLRKLAFDGLARSNFEDTAKTYKNFDEIMNDFIANYKTEVANNSGDYEGMNPGGWTYNKNILVDYNFDNILSLTNETDQYTGGAHGTAYFQIFSINLKDGKIIRLQDILKGDYKTRLTKLGEKQFRQDYDLTPDADLDSAGFFFENKSFYLPDNFYIQPDGLKFKYNEYEVAAYALGTPEILIPFSEIKELIREDGILYHLNSKNKF